jgi:predicted nucleic acid-binding protein
VWRTRRAPFALRPISSPRSDDVLEACSLLQAHAGLGARDALHAAVMKNSQLHVLVSVDRDFDVIPDLKRIAPAQALALIR